MDTPGCEDDIIINTSDPRQGLGIVFVSFLLIYFQLLADTLNLNL